MRDIIKHFLYQEVEVDGQFLEEEYEVAYSVYDGDVDISSLSINGVEETDIGIWYHIKCKFESDLYDNYKYYLDDKRDYEQACYEDYCDSQRELREED